MARINIFSIFIVLLLQLVWVKKHEALGLLVHQHKSIFSRISNSIINKNDYNNNRGSNNNNSGPPPRGPADSSLFMYEGSDGNESASAQINEESSDEVDKSKNPIVDKWLSISEETRDDIKTTVISFSIALLVRILLIEPRYIPSLSMFPTFDIGDQLLVDKITHVSRPYQKRDVVVFNPTETYIDLTGNTEALIKRIVAGI